MKKATFLVLAVLFLISAIPNQKKPNFLLITIDTWRADYISASGSGKVQTPFIDKLAKEGNYIQRIDTPVTLTTPAIASIMTGLYPINHNIRDNSHFSLKDNVRTMAQVFKDNGYETIGVVSGAPLKKIYGLNRGFDFYDDEGFGEEGDDIVGLSSRNAGKSARRALESIKNAKSDKVFIWLHLYDPHYPYTPPPEFIKKYPRDLYAGEVAYVDKVLGDFVSGLMAEKKGDWRILLSGDHGEGLGEKDEETHGFLLYKQTREVPLILWDSEKKMAHFGKGTKSLVDIFPTVLDLFSFQQSGCDGVSLFSDTSNARWLFSETFCPLMDFGLNPALLARKDENIFVKHGTSVEIYQGPDEEKNLYEIRKGFAATAEAELKKFFGEGHIPSSSIKLTDEEIKTLGSLGYISSSSRTPQKISSCDLREFSKDYSSYFSLGESEYKRGHPDKALFYYDIMINKYPNSSVLRVHKGYVLIEMKKFRDAKEEFQACLKLDPKNSVAMVNLGNIMMTEGKPRDAEKFYLSSLSCEKDQAEAHLNLGILYSQYLKNNDLAIKHLTRFLELAPKASQRDDVENLIKVLKNQNR
jgi:tetratricopeptide (TPR) repeat protein